VLDAPGNLRLGDVAEFELVEDVTGDPVVAVGIPQSVKRTAGIVRTWGGELLMTGLQTECRRNRRKARVEWRELHLEAAFLVAVGEGLANSERSGISGIGKSDLVVLVVGGAGPEAYRVDRRSVGTVFPFGREFGLVRIDPGLVFRAIDAGD